MREPAPAKVNLYLHVTGRRADGYHLLDSLAVFGPAADALEMAEGALSLQVTGRFAAGLVGEGAAGLVGEGAAGLVGEGAAGLVPDAAAGRPAGDDNLVLRAARALAAAAKVEPRGALALDKALPVASGIGGGSADAAAALRLLNRAWRLGWDGGRLRMVAAPLGADVPVCVESRPARMAGVGELIGPAPGLPALALLLVNPGVALATPSVFRARQGGFSPPASLPAAWADAAAMADDLRRLGNDLEAAAVGLCPPIAEVLAAIAGRPGCLLARMSGSGATCFGLFAHAAAARAAAAAMPAAWWAHAGPLYEAPA